MFCTPADPASCVLFNDACDKFNSVVCSISTLMACVQGVFRTKWNVQVKRLAYDLCKTVPVGDDDTEFLIGGIKVRNLDYQRACQRKLARHTMFSCVFFRHSPTGSHRST